MIDNINLASYSIGKAVSKSNTIGFPAAAPEKEYSFHNTLKEAVVNRSGNNIREENRPSYKKELVERSESKFRPDKKLERKEVDFDKEKKSQKKDMTADDVLAMLKELTELQELGAIPAEKHTAIIEDINSALKQLADAGAEGTVINGEPIDTKLSELIRAMESMLKGLNEKESIDGRNIEADFAMKLKTFLDETVRILTDNTEVGLLNNEVVKESIEVFAANLTSLLETAPESEKDVKGNTEKSETRSAETLTAAAAVSIDGKSKQNHSVEEDSSEAVKSALDNKVEKITVESREGRNQDNSSETKKETAGGAFKSVNTEQNKIMNEEFAAARFDQAMTDNKVEAAQKLAETPKTQTVNKAEVINQIVKKAQLILTDSQPEMRMQLEPENLGRLTLKIAVERGLITAKFVAESQEVKQIIESNFNELRDMLQEKGLDVQNFSVSVGQDNRGFENSSSFQQWKETVKFNGRNRAGYDGYLEGEGTISRIANPYSIHNGQFDHKA